MVSWPDTCGRHRAHGRRAVLRPAADPAGPNAPLAPHASADGKAGLAVPGIRITQLTVPRVLSPCMPFVQANRQSCCLRPSGIQNRRESRSEIVKTAFFAKTSLRLWQCSKDIATGNDRRRAGRGRAERQGKYEGDGTPEPNHSEGGHRLSVYYLLGNGTVLARCGGRAGSPAWPGLVSADEPPPCRRTRGAPLSGMRSGLHGSLIVGFWPSYGDGDVCAR